MGTQAEEEEESENEEEGEETEAEVDSEEKEEVLAYDTPDISPPFLILKVISSFFTGDN